VLKCNVFFIIMYGIPSLGLGLGLMTLYILPIFSYINNGKTVTVIVFHCFISLKPLQVGRYFSLPPMIPYLLLNLPEQFVLHVWSHSL